MRKFVLPLVLAVAGIAMVSVAVSEGYTTPLFYWTGSELSIELVSSPTVSVQAGSTFDIELRFKDVGTVPGWNEQATVSVWDYWSTFDKDDVIPFGSEIASATYANITRHDEVKPDFLPSGKTSFDRVVTIEVNTKSGGYITDAPYPRHGVVRVFINYGYYECYSQYIEVELTAPPTSYTLVTSVLPSGSGTVTPSSGAYSSGALVWVSANPTEDYVFDHWSGDLSGVIPQNRPVFMYGNRNVVANFRSTALPDYFLETSVYPSDGGTVEPSSGSYVVGSSITIKAIPENGYTFDHWSGDASGDSPQVTVVMEGDKLVEAHFTELPPMEEPFAYQPALFWSGISLVVVGAVVGAVLWGKP